MRFVVIFLLYYFTYLQALEAGDDCYLEGRKGRCINVHNCPYAKSLLQNNENPGFCGFEKNNVLVCCAEGREPGAISAQKCEEYHPKRYFIIIGGAKPSLAREFPHMAIIGAGERDNIQWLCGGSLISYTFVLTAAHCLKSSELGNARYVRLGDLDLSTDTDEAAPQDFNVKRFIAHPEYRRPSRYHDIGLIELDRTVQRSEFVSMACLDTRREHNETKMIVTGWGRTEFSGAYSSFLLKADFDIVPNDICRSFYARTDTSYLPIGVVDDLQICAGGTREQDTCQGDSGGPLQILNRERTSGIFNVFEIVGITSFGKACGISATPGVYTRVHNYLSWIEDIVWP